MTRFEINCCKLPKAPYFKALTCLMPVLLMLCSILWVSPSWAKPNSGEHILLVLGDSLSAGYGLPQNQGWVDLMAKRLRGFDPSIRVVNASISGDTSAGGLSRLPALLQTHQPRWVVIELGANDGLRGSSLGLLEQNLATMVEAVASSGAQPILLGVLIPPNYGKKYTSAFAQVYPTIAQRYDIPLLPFLLQGVAGNADLMQADRLHPNAAAQPIIEAHVWTFLQPLLTSP